MSNTDTGFARLPLYVIQGSSPVESRLAGKMIAPIYRSGKFIGAHVLLFSKAEETFRWGGGTIQVHFKQDTRFFENYATFVEAVLS